ncbi:MAG: TonB-dependent receptor plug domain-containing protein, partial [Calditrichaceae bacterium]
YREIPYVNIYIKNQSIGTSTQPDGSFTLNIPESYENLILVFEHVSYDTLQMAVSRAIKQSRFYLFPSIIQSNTISIEAERNYSILKDDLPQPASIISSKNFDIQGYVDAGDLLKNEPSVQIEEDLSGEKTIAMRAGNADDVIILYNGVKMNSIYNNVFDLSLINIEDIRQFEIIRGSNTSLYGPGAFSGVVNIVPKIYKNYNIRFTQRIGTYASGDWNLQLNYNFKNHLNLSYGYKQGGTKREYLDDEVNSPIYLTNNIENHSAKLVYYINNDDDDSNRLISLSFVQSGLDHNNDKYNEAISNLNRLVSLNYEGAFWEFKKFSFTGAYQWYNHNQNIIFDNGFIDRKFEDKNFNLNMEEKLAIANLDINFASQYEYSTLDLNDQNESHYQQNIGIESALFDRNRIGVASILKLHAPTGSSFLKLADLDVAYRYDYVDNGQTNTKFRSENPYNIIPLNITDNDWNESTFKISSHLLAESRLIRINSYMNFGSNVKFPTLYQQISSPAPARFYTGATQPDLNPEKNTSLDIGTSIIQELNDQGALNGWQFDFNYFKNYYDNKFRMYYSPGIPIASYDNVQNAVISGIESNINLFMVKRKITFNIGASKYFISEKAAFPYKSDLKSVVNLYLDHAGYSFRAMGFYENDQIAWVRDPQNHLWQIQLPGYSNLDLHLNKTVEFKDFKIFLNLSARNIFDNDTVLEGIAIRDRRYYITFGAQY